LWFIETSAVDKTNVSEAFTDLVTQIVSPHPSGTMQGPDEVAEVR
jgi:hypothetical protein